MDQTANNAPTGDDATPTGTGRTDTGKDGQTREIPLGMEFVRTVLTGNLKGDPLPSERGVIWGGCTTETSYSMAPRCMAGSIPVSGACQTWCGT